jgi:hypothetical protein
MKGIREKIVPLPFAASAPNQTGLPAAMTSDFSGTSPSENDPGYRRLGLLKLKVGSK